MPTIDIPLKPDLQKAFDLKPCEALKVPSPKPLKVQLPSGGSLQAFNDISKGIPNDCSMSFNLLLQVAPLLASMDCLLKILKVLKPLVEIVTGLTKVPPKPPADALAELPGAIEALVPCFLIPTPASLLPFVKDILCLIRAVLKCLLQQFKSLRDLMQGLSLRLEAAQGNDDLLATLQCAQDNAASSANNLTQAIEPITVLLGLVSPVMEMAGLPSLELKAPGASPTDVAAMDELVNTLQAVVDAIDDVTGGICGD